MASDSTPSSRVSLISLDPAVASHITATTVPSTSQYGSSPRKSTNTPDTDATRRHMRNNSAPNTWDKKRSNSLRRVKNSTEILRQRSTKSARRQKQQDLPSDTRGGRNFTVGNVGTGGILYLTPSAYQTPGLHSISPISPAAVTTPVTAPALLGQELLQTASQTVSDGSSQARSTSSKQSIRPAKRRVAVPNHGRSQSFSTVEDHRHSLSAAVQSRTLRIVINRPETARPQTAKESIEELNEELSPTLEVPIPHYRIGTFRFSNQGTPDLRNSSFTRTSVTPSDATPNAATTRLDHYFQGPPASSLKAFARLGAAQLGADDDLTTSNLHGPISYDPATGLQSINSVEPAAFDQLIQTYDDPSVVRYCQNVREITAATPARIIAQISSDSFMDYELVSDFFLTFRSYMSTYTVLDLLLARLRWAIGRLEDDGRIIRVRTFAALRHWILNYFMDDFYVDLGLRERFCSEVNRLYIDVKACPENGYSDLKLLRDLKRCWNGRCSLCWDPEGFELDGDQEEDLQPGGPIDIQSTPRPRTAIRPFHPPAEIPRPDILRGPSHSWFEVDKTLGGFHERQQSTNSDQIPPSLGSDGSLQANSCFPSKAFLRSSPENSGNTKGPHPVSVQHRRKNAPANLQVNTHSTIGSKSSGHKRGASSIDSNREPTPRKAEAEEPDIVGEDGNIIRGLLYSPSAPFVQIVSTSSTQSLDRNEVQGVREGPRRGHGTQSATHPTGRNIFGSLRKVLGNKHGQPDVTLLTASHSAQDVPIRSQKTAVPLHLSKSHDELRNQTQLTHTRKGEVRIDLLCAAVCQNYESKFPSKHRITYGAFFASNPPVEPVDGNEDELKTPRLNNRATAQSGSILIVDDTRPDLPSMSGALRPNTDDMIGINPIANANRLFEEDAVMVYPIRSDSLDAVATQRSSDVLGVVMNVPSADGSNDTLEKFAAAASYPGEHFDPTSGPFEERVKTPTTVSSRTVQDDNTSLELPRPADNGDTTEQLNSPGPTEDAGSTGDEDEGSENQDRAPPPTLRRRPGGDLRRVENVQELDHVTHHDSLDSVSAASDSPHDSLLIMRTDTGRTNKRDQEPPTKTVSMINTHSSQHLRPSFEAAVAEFSAIPDDDDGGLEATLLKLEGRYEKKSPPLEQHPLDTTGKRRSLPDLKSSSQIDLRDARPARQSFDVQVREVTGDFMPHSSLDGFDQAVYAANLGGIQSSSRRSSIFGLPTESVAESEESTGSLPLLKRDTAHESTTVSARAVRGPIIAPGYFAQDPPQLFHLPKGPPPSGNKHAHQHSLSRPDTANDSNRSFLLDEDENLSDLSSEISVDIINYSDVVDSSIGPMLAAPGTALSGLEIPAHPLTYASVVNLNALEQSARISDPIPNETNPGSQQTKTQAYMPPRLREKPSSSSQPMSRLPAGPAHLPFVLACDSQVLAQQMTLVEKSALSEVEWSGLVEMRWDSKAAEVLDWVDCLTNTRIRGIDLVITRFNLVVKWAMSEIILTQDIHERARVITKYIHVAAHARRLHNYATMLQLTIALTSIDCTRLTKTWALVSAPDLSLLKHMEALVQPVRNFHDLRLEMESADLSDGCIPFIGLYVHDLTYNAQKPSRIPGGQGRESLINFERYRTCAIIVKGLLRFIDAGSRYSFEPIEGVIERCLWLAALPDDRIRSTSKSLEY